ncbi:asparagine synthase-related protein [Granulicella sp. S190]|uniref:asparagine synthase-related protein n=1 Tax=Granulicella sp. S190 TaxID=1747226 RepID=UPI00131D92A0|nr:asparagine synthase-related protein [Granulicella sp. S190]
MSMNHYVERVVDLLDSSANDLFDLSTEQAQALLVQQPAEAMQHIDGSFALVGRAGKMVRMVRSLDRPMRYFLAKRTEGPVLIVADRIDAIYDWLKSEGLDAQFHPSYTRMIPAHYVVDLQLIGCPDPDPVYTRFFTPEMATMEPNTQRIGERYIATLADEISLWLDRIPAHEPIGVCFSGGIDSGSVFLATCHVMKTRGMSLGRLKAFVLDLGDGPDLQQSRDFLNSVGLGLFLEPIQVDPATINVQETIDIIEDYQSLDVQSASMAVALLRGIRQLYPEWRYLLDGDGGDENLKDYPIEENPELTIRSVVHNPMLYQEGWGVGKIKHSLTYSGGLSRSYTRTYGPARRFGFRGFSPYTRPKVIAVAESIPFIKLTDYSVERLYELKGEVVARGIASLTGMTMPVYPKRRFQHGAISEQKMHQTLPYLETEYRKQFLSRYL